MAAGELKEEEVKTGGRGGVLESENGVGTRGQRSGTSSERGDWCVIIHLKSCAPPPETRLKKVRIKVF